MAVELFYRLQREGSFTASSQINPSAYFQYFGPYLQKSTDIRCFCFSPGMFGTFQTAQFNALIPT